MGYNQFPKDQYFIMLTGDSITEAGNFTLSENIELGAVVCHLQKIGAHSGNETLQLHIFGNADMSTPIASSDVVHMSEIESLTNNNWVGYVKFDFDRKYLDSDNTYYFGIQCNNYTYVKDSYHWSFALDWPNDINTPAVATTRGLQAVVLGYS